MPRGCVTLPRPQTLLLGSSHPPSWRHPVSDRRAAGPRLLRLRRDKGERFVTLVTGVRWRSGMLGSRSWSGWQRTHLRGWLRVWVWALAAAAWSLAARAAWIETRPWCRWACRPAGGRVRGTPMC